MNKLQSNSMMHKLNDNSHGVEISKIQSVNKKMMLLNFIHQEQKRTYHKSTINQHDKLKVMMEEVLDRYPIVESSEQTQEQQTIVSENEKLDDFDYSNIYESNSKEPEQTIYFDNNEPKLKTVANILFSKDKLDQLIKKKKW